MRTWLWMMVATLMLLLPDAALAQAGLRPDPAPRLPPQPGQGLPINDQRFLERAALLSQAQVDAGRLALDRASDERVVDLAATLAAAHGEIQEQVEALAVEFGIAPAPGSGPEPWRELEALEGEDFDRGFLAWQMGAQLALAELYQTEASHTPIRPLATHAITTFVDIRDHLRAVRDLAAEYGVEADLLGQPPQYE
jgi:predicted outer membrane protein